MDVSSLGSSRNCNIWVEKVVYYKDIVVCVLEVVGEFGKGCGRAEGIKDEVHPRNSTQLLLRTLRWLFHVFDTRVCRHGIHEYGRSRVSWYICRLTNHTWRPLISLST
jgi:hypothetical protein